MKFLVGDSQKNRHETIRAFLNDEQSLIAVILAAIDFEWTVRRVIDGLVNPSDNVKFPEKVSGLVTYAKAWGAAVSLHEGKPLSEVVGDWKAFTEAYQLRHDVVHGRQAVTGLEYAILRVDRILAASKAVANYGSSNGANPYKRLRHRVLAGPTKKQQSK